MKRDYETTGAVDIADQPCVDISNGPHWKSGPIANGVGLSDRMLTLEQHQQIAAEKRVAYEAQERERRLNETVSYLQKAEEIRADPALMAEVKAYLREAGGKVERLLKSLG